MFLTSLEIGQLAAKAADDKKGEEILGLNIRDLTVISDYFVLVKAQNNTHARAISDEVEFKLKEQGLEKEGMDGYRTEWILLDYGSVMVHIFYGQSGGYDNLCRLWADGKKVDLLENHN